MKLSTLFGAVVGSVVGAIGWYFLETGTPPRDASWAPLVIGLLAGLGSRFLDRSSAASYFRGAVTAAIAFGVMFGARQAITYTVIEGSKSANQSIMPSTMDTEVELPGDETGTDEEVVELEVERDVSSVAKDEKSLGGKSGSAPIPIQNQSGLLAIYYAVGTLLAYFLGKGSSPTNPMTPGTPALGENEM